MAAAPPIVGRHSDVNAVIRYFLGVEGLPRTFVALLGMHRIDGAALFELDEGDVVQTLGVEDPAALELVVRHIVALREAWDAANAAVLDDEAEEDEDGDAAAANGDGGAAAGSAHSDQDARAGTSQQRDPSCGEGDCDDDDDDLPPMESFTFVEDALRGHRAAILDAPLERSPSQAVRIKTYRPRVVAARALLPDDLRPFATADEEASVRRVALAANDADDRAAVE